MILMGDTVTVSREIGDDTTWVTGRVTGLVQDDTGQLKYFYIKGLSNQLWMSDNWIFSDEQEEEDLADDS